MIPKQWKYWHVTYIHMGLTACNGICVCAEELCTGILNKLYRNIHELLVLSFVSPCTTVICM